MARSADLPQPLDLGAVSAGTRRVTASPSRGLAIGATLLPVVRRDGKYVAAGEVKDTLIPLDLPAGPPPYGFKISLDEWQGGRTLLLLFIHKGPGAGDDNWEFVVKFRLNGIPDDAASGTKASAEAEWAQTVAAVEALLLQKPAKLWHGVMGPPGP